jgi:putative tryptophan/tyrosine transport system ATP-binding protein
MIRCENLGIVFNRGTALENRALHNIDIAIAAGEFISVIGSNGAGKSTLLNLLAGELRPGTGRILIDDIDVTSWPVYRRSTVLSRMFQDPRAGICEDMSIIENIAVASARTAPRGFRFAITDELRKLAADRLAILKLGLERRLQDRVALLSGGQRQALALIMATHQGPAARRAHRCARSRRRRPGDEAHRQRGEEVRHHDRHGDA